MKISIFFRSLRVLAFFASFGASPLLAMNKRPKNIHYTQSKMVGRFFSSDKEHKELLDICKSYK